MLSSKQESVDGLFNYELHEELGRGVNSVIYRATCRRGRLRNRCVALKQLTRTPDKDGNNRKRASRGALHAALCHPSIVSLMSSFNSPTGDYHVLELCLDGSLADVLQARSNPILTENEVRGVAKSLVDALVYLKKELILHRDINPSNILVTDDGRVKLSGFGSAVRLQTVQSAVAEFCGSPNYVSPEILEGRAYSFGSDLWSFGCVLLHCLSGLPPFDAPDPEAVYDNICSASPWLPQTTSFIGQKLVRSLLCKNPQDRLQLHRVLQDPFFASHLDVIPLGLPRPIRTSPLSAAYTALRPNGIQQKMRGSYPTSLSKDPSRPRPRVGQDAKTKHERSTKRVPFEDITNVYSERSQGGSNAAISERYIVTAPYPTRFSSDPVPLAPYESSAHAPRSVSATQAGARPPPGSAPGSVAGGDLRRQREGLTATTNSESASWSNSPRTQLRRVLSDSDRLGSAGRAISLGSGRPILYPRQSEGPVQRISSQATSTTAVTHHRSSATENDEKESPALAAQIGRQDGVPSINTHRLKPQTLKVSRGQMVVLPSRSVLVDFREGERRKGGRGKEVMVVSPDGGTIQVFDAPHLSTPCCLAEATATYPLSQLPQQYMTLYKDVAKLVDQLKSRIPRLVYHLDDAKCTLMANGPPGDVEVVMPGEGDRKTSRQAIRLRLQRQTYTLEISRYRTKTPNGPSQAELGEWAKKVIALNTNFDLKEEDKTTLDASELVCMQRLSKFLRICSAADSA
ncbi:kinase-like protein [Trametes sanguinea]|nr:kinase-like protein [Trametes sanguinea]